MFGFHLILSIIYQPLLLKLQFMVIGQAVNPVAKDRGYYKVFGEPGDSDQNVPEKLSWHERKLYEQLRGLKRRHSENNEIACDTIKTCYATVSR